MKIVILDSYTVNPGDISWDSLKKFGQVIAYDRTKPKDVINRIGDAECILTSKVKITEKIFDSCPNLKYIGVLATGFDNIDIKAANARDIAVTNIAGYSTNNVTELVFAMILDYCNNINNMDESVKMGDWINSKDFCYYPVQRIELMNKTLGIIGYGAIGQSVAKVASAFGMKVLAHSANMENKPLFSGCNFATMEEVLVSSDFLTIHCPLTDATKDLINNETLAKMKKSAVLINTSRGPIVNSKDLRDALNTEVIAMAYIDVLESEPMIKEHPLLEAKNIKITPHIGWATLESRKRIIEISYSNLKAFFEGKVKNRVEYR